MLDPIPVRPAPSSRLPSFTPPIPLERRVALAARVAEAKTVIQDALDEYGCVYQLSLTRTRDATY